jgi:hypothetical protein
VGVAEIAREAALTRSAVSAFPLKGRSCEKPTLGRNGLSLRLKNNPPSMKGLFSDKKVSLKSVSTTAGLSVAGVGEVSYVLRLFDCVVGDERGDVCRKGLGSILDWKTAE